MASKFMQGVWSFLVGNWLSLAMLVGIVVGFILGFILKKLKEYSSHEIVFVGFLGELFMRLLKGISVPLTMTCIIDAFTKLDGKIAKLFGVELAVIMILTKIIAVILALVMVIICHPGRGKVELTAEIGGDTRRNAVDNFLDMIKNIFPNNIPGMFVKTMQTNLTKEGNEIVGIDEHLVDFPNMLGIVCFSIVAGIALKSMGDRNLPIVNLVVCFGEISFIIVKLIMTIVPVLLISLVAQQIMITDFTLFFSNVGIFVLVACGTLLFHLLVVLPIIVLFLGKTNPYKLYWWYSEAMITAFASSSTLACLPIALEVLEKKYDPALVGLVVPVSLSINKDGACINLAIEAVFFAQCDGRNLQMADYILVAIFSIALSISAPGVPQGVLLMLVVVLDSLSIPSAYASTIISVDIIVDRLVTLLNVTDAAVAVCLIDNLTRKKREQFEIQKVESKKSLQALEAQKAELTI